MEETKFDVIVIFGCLQGSRRTNHRTGTSKLEQVRRNQNFRVQFWLSQGGVTTVSSRISSNQPVILRNSTWIQHLTSIKVNTNISYSNYKLAYILTGP